MDVHEWYQQHTREIEERGIEQGIAQGELKPLARLFERRLSRSLTPEERARLTERIRDEGAEHVGDVVLDLSSDELATWLAAMQER